MSDLSFFHGARTIEDPNGPILPQTAQSSVAALLLADAGNDPTAFPFNVPVAIRGAGSYGLAKKLSKKSRREVDAIFDQIGTTVYIINTQPGNSENATLSALVGDRASKTGIKALLRCESMFGRKWKPRLIGVPGHTSALASNGVVSIHATSNGANYAVPPTVTIGDGSGPQAVAIMTDDRVTGFIVTKPWFGLDPANPPTVTLSGGGGMGATAECTIGSVTNPICAELPGVLEQIRAVAYVDGPDTSDEAAFAWRQTFHSDRLYPIDPRVLRWDTDLSLATPQPASSCFIGVQAKADRDEGFHRSVSNKVINGIEGVTRPVSYGDEANFLNENGIGTIIAGDNGGWLTWGNRTASDPTKLQLFLSVRRTTDFINEEVESVYRSFNDAPMTQRNVRRLEQGGKVVMRKFRDAECIYDGNVYFDPTRNSDTELGSGKIGLAMKFLVPPPMENITVQQAYEISYFAVLRAGLLSEQNLSSTVVAR